MPDAPAVTPVAQGTAPWPEQTVREYVARGWWRGRALGTELWSAADVRPGAPAVIDGAVRLTYRSVTARYVSRTAPSITAGAPGRTSAALHSSVPSARPRHQPRATYSRTVCSGQGAVP